MKLVLTSGGSYKYAKVHVPLPTRNLKMNIIILANTKIKYLLVYCINNKNVKKKTFLNEIKMCMVVFLD